MKTSETITKIAPSLLKAQRKMGAASKGAANPYFKSKYADLGAVMEVVKDPLNEENITILQPAYSKDGSHFVETTLVHESGEWISSEPLKLELNKTDMQQLGSAITYARRYTLQSLLGIPAEDDDGEVAVGRAKTTERPKTPNLAARATPSVLKAENPQLTDLVAQAASITPPAGTVVTAPAPSTAPPKSFTTFRQQKKAEATQTPAPVTNGLNF